MFKKLSEKLLGKNVSVEERMPEEVIVAIPREEEEIESDFEQEHEYAESREDAREFEEAGRDSERTAESLEDFRNALAILNDKGGVTQESFVYAQVAASAFESKLGLEMLDVEAVSFEGLEADVRVKLSLEKIDFAIEHLKNVKQIAQEQFEAAQSRVKSNAPSLENFSLVEEIRDVRSLENLIEKHEALVDDQTSLEELRDLIASANEQGGVSFESLVLINYAVEQLAVANGVETPYLTDSLESLDQNGRHQISLENVDIAVESLGDLARKAYDKVAGAFKKAWQKIGNALGVLKQMIPEAIEELEDFKKKLVENKDAAVDGKIDGKFLKKLHENGKVPTDLVKYLHEYAEFALKFISTYGVEAQKAFANNIKVMRDDLLVYSAQSFEESLEKVASNWKNANQSFEARKDISIPGEGSIFDKNDDYSDNASNNKHAQAIAENYRYTLAGTWMRPNRSIRNVPDEMDALSVKDLKDLVESYIKVLKSIDVDKLIVSADLVHDYWAFSNYIDSPLGIARQIRRKMRKEINILHFALAASFLSALEFPLSMARSTVRVARTIIAVGKASLEKVSTESIQEEVSLEASVKELKSGQKVRFSHGHGKIKKIFTSEFKIGGKHHKASKDDPRFLVAADKGGHLSIHKASALTIV